MAHKKAPAPASTHTDTTERWLHYLHIIDPKGGKWELLSMCFFNEFVVDPTAFFDFLSDLEAWLSAAKPSAARRKVAANYLTILSPLAERFGFFEQKALLDTLAFRLSQPSAFAKIDKSVRTYKQESKRLIQRVQQQLKTVITENDYQVSVSGRFKNEYSVYKKLKVKGMTHPSSLYDIFACRIIVQSNSTEECFDILNLLHDRFTPIAARLKDYISIPKINGYQSLHTCLTNVIPELSAPVEVQIRTAAMDTFAEHGIATHWLYGQTKHVKLLTETEHQLLDHFSDLSKRASEQHQVFFFSKAGEVFSLPSGATALDFAYHLHTDLGNKADYALVNAKKQSLDHELQQGDEVEIVLGKRRLVSADRVHWAHLPSTKRKIHEHTRS